MKELASGSMVQLTNGKSAKVIKELGRGGQGIVYLVELNGKKMALKWYLRPGDNEFYDNLAENIRSGAPDKAFLWPQYLTKKIDGYYGYIMDLRPDGYFELGLFLIPQLKKGQKFTSFSAMVNAAMKICEGFRMLHLKGYSYQDLNDGNFFINPNTGDVLICDNDNVMAQGQNSGIGGKAHYMAPEVVGGQLPDRYSDRCSLSIILFRLFFLDHPFDGERVSKAPCLTDELDRKFFGSDIVFIFDPKNTINRPVRGVHENAIRRWPLFPEFFREAFIDEFSHEKLYDSKSQRKLEQAWEKTLLRLRDCIVACPFCHKETLIDIDKSTKSQCVNDGKAFVITKTWDMPGRKYLLTGGTKIYFDIDNLPDAEVYANPKDGMLMVRNLSKYQWMAETASGALKTIDPLDSFPAVVGLKVTVTVDNNGIIAKQTGRIS